jgi:hypothetical protein
MWLPFLFYFIFFNGRRHQPEVEYMHPFTRSSFIIIILFEKVYELLIIYIYIYIDTHTHTLPSKLGHQ